MPDMVSVKVTDGYAVLVDGEQVSGGSVVQVPPDVADAWQVHGWVTRTKAKPRPTPQLEGEPLPAATTAYRAPKAEPEPT